MPRFPFCNLHLLRSGWRGTLPAFLCLKLHLPRPSFPFFFFLMSPILTRPLICDPELRHISRWSHTSSFWELCCQVGSTDPTASRWDWPPILKLSFTWYIHLSGEKKTKQKNSLQELEEKCNGSRKCSCSVGSGCVLPEHPPCTKDAQPHRMALTDPIIGPGGHIRPPTRHRLQAQFHTFWFSSWSGTIVPQGAPKGQELALTALLPGEKRHSKMVGMLGIRTRSWGLCGHQCCSEGAGGLGQRGAAQECCDNSRCLQWPFKPDWKLLRIARLTKKAVLGELWNGLCVFNVSQWLGWDSAV